MGPMNHEKWESLRRAFGHDIQFKIEALEDGRTAIVMAHYFSRPSEVHRRPPELSRELYARIAEILNVCDIEVQHGTDTDEIWGLVIEDLPTLILIPCG